jgi:predicted ATPase/DNA-binding CsgD family transcriptional regulator
MGSGMYHHFPAWLTTFIGRSEELKALTNLLANCRLLTLLGPGGTGKTRLAVEAALRVHEQFRDGVYFVPLQGLTTPELVLYAIASALGIGMYERDTPRSQLAQYLQPRHTLLLLDNFEHVIDAADLLMDLLANAPHLQLLVTSREVLNLPGEQVFEVGGLAEDAARLFMARAQGVRHDFSADQREVLRICQLVEGMPLAIELAAGWTRVLSCAEIADEIERSLDFLTTGLRGLPERHRSMRAVFDSSWQRLSPDAQRVFSRLSVFRGRFDREAAATVADASLSALSALVDHSLLRTDGSGGYTMHDLLRSYADEKLDGRDALMERHSAYYLGLLHRLDAKIKSAGQIAALDEIERALDNIRIGWRYAVDHQRVDLVLPAFECLTLYYQMRCRHQEGFEAFALAAERFRSVDEYVYLLMLLGKCWFAGFCASVVGDQIAEMEAEILRLLERHPMRGDAGITLTKYSQRRGAIIARKVEENLAAYREKGDNWGIAWMLERQGASAYYELHDPAARSILEESAALFGQIGDRWGATWSQALLGLIAEDEGRYRDAYGLYTTRWQTCIDVGDAGGIAWSLQQIAKVSLELDDLEQARYYCRESLRVALDISTGNSVNEAISRIASMYLKTGQLERALELYGTLLHTWSYAHRHIERHLARIREALPPAVYEQAVNEGRRMSIRELGRALLDELADHPPVVERSAGVDALSERELEVLRLAAQGLSNREIAARLVVTLGTVKKHLNNIFGKLGADRRTQAVARARERGLI